MDAGTVTLFASVVTVGGVLLNTLLANLIRVRNRNDHGEVGQKLERLTDVAHTIRDDLSSHLLWHAHEEGPSIHIVAEEEEEDQSLTA